MPPALATSDTASRTSVVNISFIYNEYVGVIENFNKRTPVASLRIPLCQQIKAAFGIDIVPAQLKLRTMIKTDGSWPTEATVSSAASRATVVTNSIGTEFEDAGTEGHIQLRVTLSRATDNNAPGTSDHQEPDEDLKPAGTETSTVQDQRKPAGYDVVDTKSEAQLKALRKFNLSCGTPVLDKKRKHSDVEQGDNFKLHHMAFSDFSEHQTRRMFHGVQELDFRQKQEDLPADLVKTIKDRFAELVKSGEAPWNQQEAQRRRFIDALMTPIVAAVNVLHEKTKGKLDLRPEHTIQDSSLMAGGVVDWVIARGKRMLVVIEAKQYDIFKHQHQLLAMMEAARIINGGQELEKVHALITDFQNWMFVEREGNTLRRDFTGTGVPDDWTQFPEALLPVCKRLYCILLNL